MMRVGIDVGGTKIAVGLVDGGNILAKERFASYPGAPQSTIADMAREVEALVSAHGLGLDQIEGVGVGFAGTVDSGAGVVRTSANLRWTDVDVRTPLSSALGLPVRLVNDADAAAWAEYRFGAARGYDSVVAITVGTGIGGALIFGDRVFEGRHGLAGELGHFTYEPGGLPCGCGRVGCWEQYCSGSRMNALAAERLPATNGLATARDVDPLAHAGDPVALGIFEEIGTALGAGMASLGMIFDPDLFLIGGGVSESGELLLEPTRREYTRQMGLGGFPCAKIVAASLGNDAGIIGAADLGAAAG
ncbi:MAG: ROK family protein [Trueperella sp.]|uniref:ROK family protein n=1 Tax=Trueperella sp. TaxID=2699835 RepID=UPI002A90AAD7|nr:ROK family protein [Trueperella sp.]MDY5402932.1 ROK family protein [Trueperella sp.]